MSILITTSMREFYSKKMSIRDNSVYSVYIKKLTLRVNLNKSMNVQHPLVLLDQLVMKNKVKQDNRKLVKVNAVEI